MEKNFELYEKILFYSQYKANRDDVIRIFNFLIGASEIHDKDSSEFENSKNKLLNNIRKTKIKNILKD